MRTHADNAEAWSPDFGRTGGEAPLHQVRSRPRILVMGDFSARAAAGCLDRGDDLAARKPLAVDFDNFEDFLQRVAPKATLPLGESGTPVSLSFNSLDDFHPDRIYASQELFAKLRDLRRQLGNSATLEKAAAQLALPEMPGAARLVSALHRRDPARGMDLPASAKLGDFARLVGKPRPRQSAAAATVNSMIQEIVAPFVTAAMDKGRQAALIAAVDQGLSDAMRAVLHHPDFQMLESLWRGLDFLARRLETGAEPEVHVCDLSAEEFAGDLGAAEDLTETALYRLLVEQPSLTRGGGYSLILGLYEFEFTPPHAELLGRMAKIAVHAGAVFASGLRPDVALKADAKLPPLVVSSWKALRTLPEASALALASPRFMLRQPYGKKSDPIDSFEFEEFTPQEGLRSLLWGHPALLLASALTQPGDRVQESVDDLPYYCCKADDGETIPLPCSERALTVTLANQLVHRGITAVVGVKGQPALRLAGLKTLDGAPLAPLPGPGTAKRPPRRAEVVLGVKVKAQSAPVAAPAAETPSDDSVQETDAETTEAPADDLALSGGDATRDASTETPADAPSELDSALAALETPASEPAADPHATDPELAALLKSLES